MTHVLRWILAAAALSLFVVAAVHAGLVIPGPFDEAAVYEASVGVVLTIGLGLTFVGPTVARWGGITALVIALVGASIGMYMAIRGIGPNSVPDMVYHVALIAFLLTGIVVAWRAGPGVLESGS